MTQKNFCDHFRFIDGGRGERLLPRRELRGLVPVSDMTIWRWERDGLFPRHLSINGRNYWQFRTGLIGSKAPNETAQLVGWINEQGPPNSSPHEEAHLQHTAHKARLSLFRLGNC
jgi:hypothetical protein